ncbi:MAG: ThiF family adenylyltransferase [Opitutales bacterium]
MSYLKRIHRCCADLSLTREELAYYARHLLLPSIGTRGQLKLKCARVLVVGAGGLGCPVLQALAGAGVGQLTIVDGDSVDITNVSRQWLHTVADAGENKATSAKATLHGLNPYIEIEAHAEMLNEENADQLIGAHDLVVDATDDLEVRYLIDDACADLDIPWVHAALFRGRSQLTVLWSSCGARFRALYPEGSDAPSCAGAGMLGATASVVANLQALEVIKLIVGSSRPKIGELVSMDASGVALQTFTMPGVHLPEPIAENPVRECVFSVDALRQARSIHEPLTLIDVRSANQQGVAPLPKSVHCPAESVLEHGLPDGLSAGAKLILLCDEGLISGLMADALRARGHANVYFLEGGLSALAK